MFSLSGRAQKKCFHRRGSRRRFQRIEERRGRKLGGRPPFRSENSGLSLVEGRALGRSSGPTRPSLPDPKDDMVLELAVASRARYIVTYNGKDFAAAGRFGIQAVTPKAFLDVIGG